MSDLWRRALRSRLPMVLVLTMAASAALAGGWYYAHRPTNVGNSLSAVEAHGQVLEISQVSNGATDVVTFPQASWQAASLKIEPAARAELAQAVSLTGKISLNEDRLAHVFPLVEGRVDEVKVHFGDKVKQGDLLVVVQSKEVGQAMLQLYQDRMQRDFAITKDRWAQTVVANTQAMIGLIRQDAPIEDIERQLQDRPMGEYREKLMGASIAHYKGRKHLERVSPLAHSGAVSSKQLLEAEAEVNATRATLQSLLEQLQQDTHQTSLASKQAVKELETRVSVHETNLRILGFTDDAISGIDPHRQGEAISHYPVYAPFDGTIISKDVVLMERVGPDSQILSIADLSSVWVTADIYEVHLPLLKQLAGQTIVVRSDAWPGKQFAAQVFYTGDLVNESSRTIALRALASNKDELLKPGMFVSVELPSLTVSEVLQIPLAAVQNHDGKAFAFVHQGGDAFERRDIELGRRSTDRVEILKGLRPGELVVTSGGFALKSQMLAALVGE